MKFLHCSFMFKRPVYKCDRFNEKCPNSLEHLNISVGGAVYEASKVALLKTMYHWGWASRVQFVLCALLPVCYLRCDFISCSSIPACCKATLLWLMVVKLVPPELWAQINFYFSRLPCSFPTAKGKQPIQCATRICKKKKA